MTPSKTTHHSFYLKLAREHFTSPAAGKETMVVLPAMKPSQDSCFLLCRSVDFDVCVPVSLTQTLMNATKLKGRGKKSVEKTGSVKIEMGVTGANVQTDSRTTATKGPHAPVSAHFVPLYLFSACYGLVLLISQHVSRECCDFSPESLYVVGNCC